MLIGKFRDPLLWMSADNNKDFYKKKLMSVLPSKALGMVSKTHMTQPLPCMPQTRRFACHQTIH